MGYTHYWTYNQAADDVEKFAKAVAEIKKLLGTEEVKDIHLCGETSKLEPILDKEEVYLNGVEEDGHDDFYVKVNQYEESYCKTAKKPYDLVVMLCLIAFANNLKRFTFSSDGDFDKEWLPARKLYEREIRKLRKSVFKGE